ncbi:MAG: hypothetical protein V1779_09550 [bacterium]
MEFYNEIEKKMCIASLNSGEDYKIKYYRLKKDYKDDKIVNLQLRYLFDAIEKFVDLSENNFTANEIEEGILIINHLSNSLLILGGMNDKSGKDHTPTLLELYNGSAWNLEVEENDAYLILKEMNEKYSNLSKHINKKKAIGLFDIDYKKIKMYVFNTFYIWNWVLKKEGKQELSKELFVEVI